MAVVVQQSTVDQWLSVEELVWKQAWKWARLTGYEAEDLFSEAKARWFGRWSKTFDPSKGFQLSTYIYHATQRTFARIANRWNRQIVLDPTELPEEADTSPDTFELSEACSQTTKAIANAILDNQRWLFSVEIDTRFLGRYVREYLAEVGYSAREIRDATAQIKSSIRKGR